MKVKEALAILKPAQNNEIGLKDAYRAACKKYHPDLGGDLQMMQLVNLAYETLNNMDTWWSATAARQAKQDVPLTEVIQTAWDKIKHLPGINAELIGTWLWITGNTYAVKDQLKAAGFKFSKNKSAWYYHASDYRTWSNKEFSLGEIRLQYGSTELEQESSKSAIAQ